jgi:hypothetical protein
MRIFPRLVTIATLVSPAAEGERRSESRITLNCRTHAEGTTR